MADQRNEYITISAHLQASHFPAVFDLSGQYPFDVHFEVKRGIRGDEDTRPLTLQTTSSALDGTYALKHGLLEVVDLSNNTKIDFHNLDNNSTSEAAQNVSSQVPPAINDLITLPSRKVVPGQKIVRRGPDYKIPLDIPASIKQYLTSGREYRLQLSNLDLGIEWWSWGSKEELNITEETTRGSLETSSAGRVVTSRLSQASFSVVESFPSPPTISISLSKPDHSLGNDNDQEAPKTTFRVTITNKGFQTITVKSALEQSYIIQYEGPSTVIPNHPRVTSLNRSPSSRNFSITDESGNELSRNHICASGSPSGHTNPQNFTTLEPNVPITTECILPGYMVRSMIGHKCHLKIRPFGVWWDFGTTEEVLAHEASKWPMGSPRYPLMLTSEDEIVFELGGDLS